MTPYIHHVPGRLRLSDKKFRRNEAQTQAVAMMLRSIVGVSSVNVNTRAGSITVFYDPKQRSRLDLLAALEQFGCFGEVHKKETESEHVGSLFGKALVGALAQKTAHSLIGALL